MEMAPKNNYDPSGNSPNIVEADLQEMEAVDQQLDQLSNALDFFEQRTNDIIEQLKDLLHSNREIREQLAIENEPSPDVRDSAEEAEKSDNTTKTEQEDKAMD